MPTLNGAQTKRLSESLRDSFSPDALDEFLYVMLDKSRENITLDTDYRTRAYRLIRAADAEGWVLSLISAAREARPANAALQALAAEFGLGAVPPSSSLERIILESVPFVDVSTWRARLGELEGQVCQVRVPGKSAGTGFLVAPDLCLTAGHVVRSLVDGHADPRSARLRFDYKRSADGTVVSQGTEFELADDWRAAWQPPSRADSTAAPGQLPAPGELDFALLRVKGAPGEQPIGRADDLSDAPARGWVRHVGADGFGPGEPLFILQHPATADAPRGAPLKLAFGPSDGLNANQTRLRHKVNTEPGASGSPCLNASLDLVAVHHAGGPDSGPAGQAARNAAIPVAAISGYLAGTRYKDALFGP